MFETTVFYGEVVIVMKYLNRITRTLVDFNPGEIPSPAFFIFDGKRVRVKRIISQMSVRKTFNNCILYKCEIEGGIAAFKFVELRWDRDKDRWFVEKIGE